MHIGHTRIVAGDEAQQHVGQKIACGPVDPAHDPEIDHAEGAIGPHEGIAGVHVGVEEAVAKDLQEKDSDALRTTASRS